jgi:hypothetical protein
MDEYYEFIDCKLDEGKEYFITSDGRTMTRAELEKEGWDLHLIHGANTHTFKRRTVHGRGEERNLGGEDSGKVLSGY